MKTIALKKEKLKIYSEKCICETYVKLKIKIKSHLLQCLHEKPAVIVFIFVNRLTQDAGRKNNINQVIGLNIEGKNFFKSSVFSQ